MLFQKIKNIYHFFQAVGANIYFRFPSRKIKVIGVTGTNGKTTTVQMISRILKETGKKVAVLSTINFSIGEKEEINRTKFTTLSAWNNQKFIKEAVDADCQYLILETSSHALDQNRVWGVDYDVAVITNITREHLDYHYTMEKYKDAKLKLFKKLRIDEGNKKTIVVNLNMKWAEEFLRVEVDEKYGYQIKNQKSKIKSQNSEVKIIEADNIKLENNKTKFTIHNSKFTIHLPGEFNIENTLAAVCVGLSQEISLEVCSQALEKIKKVPGRMDYVENNHGLNIIIDYALTPDSMKKVGNLILKIKSREKKLIWVFGSCGQRDKGKRPIMGEIVSRLADYVIITNEDPYRENPWEIVDQIFSGAVKNKKEGENLWKIMERRSAIKKAIQLAKKGDYILITGKGAEETMAIGKHQIKWNDRNVVEEILATND